LIRYSKLLVDTITSRPQRNTDLIERFDWRQPEPFRSRIACLFSTGALSRQKEESFPLTTVEECLRCNSEHLYHARVLLLKKSIIMLVPSIGARFSHLL
jgi:hypothetical protein